MSTKISYHLKYTRGCSLSSYKDGDNILDLRTTLICGIKSTLWLFCPGNAACDITSAGRNMSVACSQNRGERELWENSELTTVSGTLNQLHDVRNKRKQRGWKYTINNAEVQQYGYLSMTFSSRFYTYHWRRRKRLPSQILQNKTYTLKRNAR